MSLHLGMSALLLASYLPFLQPRIHLIGQANQLTQLISTGMRQNYNVRIDGDQVILIPYKREHVLKYHQWMQDPFLQETTASEPLTEAEEYAMQQSWADDSKKCTFIVLDRQLVGADSSPPYVEAMAGDVNLFLNDLDDEHVAEIEVMIAEPTSRGRGLGRESLELMMAYATRQLAIHTFLAKIGLSNAASLALFQKLGYVEVGRSEVFQQATLQLSAASPKMTRILQSGGSLTLAEYE